MVPDGFGLQCKAYVPEYIANPRSPDEGNYIGYPKAPQGLPGDATYPGALPVESMTICTHILEIPRVRVRVRHAIPCHS